MKAQLAATLAMLTVKLCATSGLAAGDTFTFQGRLRESVAPDAGFTLHITQAVYEIVTSTS